MAKDTPREPGWPPLPAAVEVGHGGRVDRLEAVGVARRFLLADDRELWRLPEGPASADIVAELRELGALGIGGFVDSGEDEHGPWLIRERIAARLLAALMSCEGQAADGESWRPAVERVRAVAGRLVEAEAREIFPGTIGPRSVVLEPEIAGGPWLLADAHVHARLGHAGGGDRSGASQLSREWLTPEAAAGEAEHAGSNRWLLGLLLYRLLAGRGPFAGLGLRSAIDRLEQGVAPLPEAVAAELPPGLQGLTLRLLDPDPARRPATAAAIVAELDRFLETETETETEAGTGAGQHATLVLPPGRAAPHSEPPRPRSVARGEDELPRRPLPPDDPRVPAPPAGEAREARRSRRLWAGIRAAAVLTILGLGTAGGFALLALLGQGDGEAEAEPEPAPGEAVEVGRRSPLDLDHTSAEDCASCHPRQSAEWKRSVMGHSAKSPLFQALEMLIEEQAGRSDDCPGGAGILRSADPRTACRDPNTDLPITGSGGALWCANCHTPRENLQATLPPWDGVSSFSVTRRPLRDLQPEHVSEGIDCGFCHTVHGPVTPGASRRGEYEGNPSWLSTVTGRVFSMRPEDRLGVGGIANSGYSLEPGELLVGEGSGQGRETVPGGVHRRPSAEAKAYLNSSEFCGACHDVRLFGSDAVATPATAQHFRRLRNAYSEWVEWAALERAAGREPADCQDCHMSAFPGVCVPGEPPPVQPGETEISALRRGCPPGTHFESRRPGELPELRVAAGSGERREVTTHYFSGVDIPLTPEFDASYIDQPELDAAGIPLGGEQRRDLLLGRSFRFELGEGRIRGRSLELPVTIENTGAGHKIPAGFSQEREFWVHLKISDARGRVLYEVGRVERADEDLHDKQFVRVNVDDRVRDNLGRPLGMFGANVVDGPDVQQWRPQDGGPSRHAQPAPTRFRGRGLINLQNGFLRCVRCIGFIDREGRCQPRDDFQDRHRAARYEDGEFDIDTGECRSNLVGDEALFETYFPVGSLDAERGVLKGPDAIIDVRSAPAGVPLTWTYELGLPADVQGPLTVEARLLFRAFPPFLIAAFADYEALQAAAGLRPSGPLVTRDMLAKLEVVEIARVERELP